jgi:hypothetical protein
VGIAHVIARAAIKLQTIAIESLENKNPIITTESTFPSTKAQPRPTEKGSRTGILSTLSLAATPGELSARRAGAKNTNFI